MERVVDRENMRHAYKRVLRNKGAAGIDGMTTEELGTWLKQHWPRVREALLEGRYLPQAVRRWTYPSRMAGYERSGCQRWLIASSSKHYIKGNDRKRDSVTCWPGAWALSGRGARA